MAKSYYSESDAVDMFIDRLRGLDTDVETRLAMAGMFFTPAYEHLDRLFTAILKGPDYIEAENMVEEIMKKIDQQETMKAVIDEVSRYAENDELEADDGKNDM